MGFFYDRYFDWNAPFPENFPADAVRTALMGFLASYDPQDDAIAWFDKVKALAESMGFTANMKLYKQDPTAWPGSVADVSTFLQHCPHRQDQFPRPLYGHAAPGP